MNDIKVCKDCGVAYVGNNLKFCPDCGEIMLDVELYEIAVQEANC